jgi:hypothetical protein
VLVVQLASIIKPAAPAPAAATSSQPAVDEVSVDSITGVEVAKRSSVLMRGMRIQGRSLVVSMYEDVKSGTIDVHALNLLAGREPARDGDGGPMDSGRVRR